MPVAAIIGLITQYGIPGAQAIYNVVKTWQNKTEITDADWQQLKATNALPLTAYEHPVSSVTPK